MNKKLLTTKAKIKRANSVNLKGIIANELNSG